MSPHSNSLFTNLMFITTLSSSVMILPYEISDSILPTSEAVFTKMENLSDWKEKAFNPIPDYSLQHEIDEKVRTMIGFSSNILSNTTDIDSEYVDIVNEYFWELI